jgi:hypothetical protein
MPLLPPVTSAVAPARLHLSPPPPAAMYVQVSLARSVRTVVGRPAGELCPIQYICVWSPARRQQLELPRPRPPPHVHMHQHHILQEPVVVDVLVCSILKDATRTPTRIYTQRRHTYIYICPKETNGGDPRSRSSISK